MPFPPEIIGYTGNPRCSAPAEPLPRPRPELQAIYDATARLEAFAFSPWAIICLLFRCDSPKFHAELWAIRKALSAIAAQEASDAL